MLKLRTILELQKNLDNQKKILNQLTQDYLDLIDDDLYTVDFKAEPCFTEDSKITFTTQHKLKQKYLLRFCNDFGLILISEKGEKDNKHYKYLFKCEDI